MDAKLSIDPAGNLTLWITGAGGELPYRLEFAPPGLDDFAVRLHGGGGPYRVSKSPGGRWRCECADAKYRARKEVRSCKHVAACRCVHAFIARLTQGVIHC